VLHHQADLSAAPAALVADVEQVVRAAGWAEARVTGYELLSSRISAVARVRVSCPDEPASVVVKHVPAEQYGAWHRDSWRPEFLEEAAAYAMLSRPDVPFADRPRLFGVHPNGVLVIEDLGSEPDPLLPLDVVAPRLALVLARLHAATIGRGPLLDAERERLGLRVAGADARYDGTTAAVRRRSTGGDLLADWATALGVADSATVRALLAPVVAAVEVAGPWHAVIHDDIANHRQCPTRDGRLVLLDFENARYAHALLDVAKVVVGKFERDLDTREMVHQCPGFNSALADQYRVALADAGGPAVDDDAFATALTDAVTYTMLVQLGHLVELTGRTVVRGGLLGNLGELLARVDAVLGVPGPRRELRGVLSALGARVTLGRSLAADPAMDSRQGALR
jgi:hypothetical protein